MEIKDSPLRHIIFAALFLVGLGSFLWPQTPGYFLDTNNPEPRFVQRLTWTKDNYALRYEVIIEKIEGTSFRRIQQEFTNDHFIEVSLAPGNYRCSVIPYDFLNRPGKEAAWTRFEIQPALNPALDGSLPVFVYFEGEYMLNFTGKDLASNAVIYLRRNNGVIVYPREKYIYNNGSNGSIFFNENQLTPGDYELVVINPGGLQASKTGIPFTRSVRPEPKPAEQPVLPEPVKPIEYPVQEIPKPEPPKQEVPEPTEQIAAAETPQSEPVNSDEPVEVVVSPEPEKIKRIKRPGTADFFISGAWMPLFPVYGEENYIFGKNRTFSGAAPGFALRFGVISSRPNSLNPGLELAGSWYTLEDRFNGDTIYSVSADLNMLLRKQFPNGKTALIYRLGAGLYVLPLGIDILEFIHTNLGVSFYWLFVKHAYLETGFNYSHFFTEPPSGCIRPWIGLGLKF